MGRASKIHLVVDGAGRVLAFTVTPGQVGDARPAHGLLANLPPPAPCAADAAYASNGLRHLMLGRGTTPVIPNTPTRVNPHPLDERAYEARNIVEHAIGRLKDCAASTPAATSSPPICPQPLPPLPSRSDGTE